MFILDLMWSFVSFSFFPFFLLNQLLNRKQFQLFKNKLYHPEIIRPMAA